MRLATVIVFVFAALPITTNACDEESKGSPCIKIVNGFTYTSFIGNCKEFPVWCDSERHTQFDPVCSTKIECEEVSEDRSRDLASVVVSDCTENYQEGKVCYFSQYPDEQGRTPTSTWGGQPNMGGVGVLGVCSESLKGPVCVKSEAVGTMLRCASAWFDETQVFKTSDGLNTRNAGAMATTAVASTQKGQHWATATVSILTAAVIGAVGVAVGVALGRASNKPRSTVDDVTLKYDDDEEALPSVQQAQQVTL